MFDNLKKIQYSKKDNSFYGEKQSTTNNVRQYLFSENSNEWIIDHGFDTQNVIVQTYDSMNIMIIPEHIEVDNNSIKISFSSGISGFVNILFIDSTTS
jgi:hypothetical protein